MNIPKQGDTTACLAAESMAQIAIHPAQQVPGKTRSQPWHIRFPRCGMVDGKRYSWRQHL
jgi:hypothetical protein